METHYSAIAYAKINLHLSIGPKAEDGFHSIASLFQSISLADRISLALPDIQEGLEKEQGGRKVERGGQAEPDIVVEGEFDCLPESTTLYKAARLFLERQGIRSRLYIRVDKGIPAKAGLGGGSADAAALLVLLDKAFGTGLDQRELIDLGLSVGSDVPFFFKGGTAFVHGRGELIEVLPPIRDLGILLICPSFGVSTGSAYAALDAWRAEKPIEGNSRPWDKTVPEEKKRQILDELGKPLDCWAFKNDFSPVLYREYPIYKPIEALLHSEGAAFVSVSGSGSSIFGLFESQENARQAKERLIGDGVEESTRKLLYGMALHAIKPLETSLRLG